MANEIDYVAVLADLEARKAIIEAGIVAVRQILAMGPETQSAASQSANSSNGGEELASDVFFGMTMAEAARKYLRMKKRPQSIRVIADALLQGGFPTRAGDLYANLYTAMKRTDDFTKVKRGEWGLAEWYRGGTRSESDNE